MSRSGKSILVVPPTANKTVYGSYQRNPLRVTRDPGWLPVTEFKTRGLMPKATDRYTATRLSADLNFGERKYWPLLSDPKAQRQAMPSLPIPFALFSPKGRASQL